MKDQQYFKEISMVVCPICEEYYLIRDIFQRKRSIFKNEKIVLDTLNKTIKWRKSYPNKSDKLTCVNCGHIKNYDGEPTLPYTTENYEKFYTLGHLDLQTAKHRKKRRQFHLDRLHAIKGIIRELKKGTDLEGIKAWNEGRGWQVKDFLEGINHMGEVYHCILLKIGVKKGELNPKLLQFLIDSFKKRR